MAPSVYFFFVDGIGIGPSADSNPFATLDLPAFRALSGACDWVSDTFLASSTSSRIFKAIDATLGVDGLPQSGTGQSTLFTGGNCAARAGRHWGPFPHSSSRSLLASQSLFHQVGADDSAFANAYPERFFAWASERDRWPTTTRCCLDSGVTIRTLDHLRSGNAIAADLTAEGLSRVAESPVPTISEDEAAASIARLTSKYRFVVSEYFHTDKAGHAQDMTAAGRCLVSIDRFLAALDTHLDWERTTLGLTSDHGNLEDLSTRTHTRHPVPLLALGRSAASFAQVEDLTGVAGAILDALN